MVTHEITRAKIRDLLVDARDCVHGLEHALRALDRRGYIEAIDWLETTTSPVSRLRVWLPDLQRALREARQEATQDG